MTFFDYDIYILSYGINPERDISLKNYKTLHGCSHVYTLNTNPGLTDFLNSESIAFTDISYLYKEGEQRSQIYSNIAEFVVAQAKENKGICYLTYGHPMVLDTPVRLIVERAKEDELSTLILPSVSFIDEILAYKQISIGSSGFQVFDATSLVVNRYTIEKRSPCFIAQIGAFGDAKANGESINTPEKFNPLINYLRQYYSPEHLVIVCDIDELGKESIFCEIPLCLLPVLSKGINYATTLYIPADNS